MNEQQKSVLDINLNRLEIDARDHPKLRREWGDKFALAKRDAKLAKAAFELMEANLKRAIRKDPARYGAAVGRTGSPSEDVVQATVISCPGYQQAQMTLIQKEYERDVIGSFLEAVQERGEQINNEVKLHGQGYFSKVFLSSENKEAYRRNVQGTFDLGEEDKPPPPAKPGPTKKATKK